VPDDITGFREPGPDGKPVWVEGILKKGEMRKDDAQMFIMKARVLAGWIEQDAIEQLVAAQQPAETATADLTEEERALLALGELGGADAADAALEELEFDLDALAAEGGDDEAAPKE
jgi:N utilization substance protein A